jgi:hypothetical protein
MRRLPISFIAVFFLLVSGVVVHPFADASNRRMRKYKPPPPMGQLEVTVVRAADGKPLKNAAVVFHPKSEDGENDGNMELKTNEDGKATLNIIPIGSRVLVQVIVPGYRTFGEEYDVPSSTNSVTVKLLPPEQPYSVYGKNSAKSDRQTNTPQTQMGHAEPADSPLLTPPEKKK